MRARANSGGRCCGWGRFRGGLGGLLQTQQPGQFPQAVACPGCVGGPLPLHHGFRVVAEGARQAHVTGRILRRGVRAEPGKTSADLAMNPLVQQGGSLGCRRRRRCARGPGRLRRAAARMPTARGRCSPGKRTVAVALRQLRCARRRVPADRLSLFYRSPGRSSRRTGSEGCRSGAAGGLCRRAPRICCALPRDGPR